MSHQLPFEKLHNIRDLGGERTTDGRVIKDGKLFRCGQLSELSDADKEKLGPLLSVVVDFRTDGECAEKPDAEFPGVSYVHLPVVDSLTAGISREAEADRNIFERLLLKPAEAKRYMCMMYRDFAENDFAVSQYAAFVRLLLKEHEKAVLWHCTAGKDRAGIAAVIVEELLGVPQAEIIEEYLSTNRYLEKDILFLTDFVKKQAGTESTLADEALRYLFGAEREYIETFYGAVDGKFVSFEVFRKEGLRISDEDMQRLKDLYLD